MTEGYVSVQDFKRLEEKVNRLLSIHELDSVLTGEEKQLVDEAREDIRNRKKEKFVNVNDL